MRDLRTASRRVLGTTAGLIAAGAALMVSGAGCTALVQFDDFGDASIGASTVGGGSDSGHHGGTTVVESDGAVVTTPGDDDDGADGSTTTTDPMDGGGGTTDDGGATLPSNDGGTIAPPMDAAVDACVTSTPAAADDAMGTTFSANGVCGTACGAKQFSRYCTNGLDICGSPILDGGGEGMIGCGVFLSGTMDEYRCPNGCFGAAGTAFCNPCIAGQDGYVCQAKDGYQLSYKALLVHCLGGAPVLDDTETCKSTSCSCGTCSASN